MHDRSTGESITQSIKNQAHHTELTCFDVETSLEDSSIIIYGDSLEE